MTGGQDSSALGRLVDICKGLGVEPNHLNALQIKKSTYNELVQIMKDEFAYNGVSVIIPQRECVQTAKRKKKK